MVTNYLKGPIVNIEMYKLVLLVVVVVVGFTFAFLTSKFTTSPYVSVAIVIATAYIAYVIKSNDPKEPKVFSNFFSKEGKKNGNIK